MTRFILEWAEHTIRQVVVEAPSMEAIEADWDEGYGSAMVDAFEACSTEVDGGIDWGSAHIVETVDTREPDVIYDPTTEGE